MFSYLPFKSLIEELLARKDVPDDLKDCLSKVQISRWLFRREIRALMDENISFVDACPRLQHRAKPHGFGFRDGSRGAVTVSSTCDLITIEDGSAIVSPNIMYDSYGLVTAVFEEDGLVDYMKYDHSELQIVSWDKTNDTFIKMEYMGILGDIKITVYTGGVLYEVKRDPFGAFTILRIEHGEYYVSAGDADFLPRPIYRR